MVQDFLSQWMTQVTSSKNGQCKISQSVFVASTCCEGFWKVLRYLQSRCPGSFRQ